MKTTTNKSISKLSKNFSLAKLVVQNVYQIHGVRHFGLNKLIEQERFTNLAIPKDVLAFRFQGNLNKILDKIFWIAIKL